MCHRGAQGQAERFSGILTDLTASRALQERQRLAATVVDNTIEGVMVTDAQARILSINPAVTRMLGYTEQEIAAKVGYKTASAVHKRIAKIADAYEDFVTAEYGKYLDKHERGTGL